MRSLEDNLERLRDEPLEYVLKLLDLTQIGQNKVNLSGSLYTGEIIGYDPNNEFYLHIVTERIPLHNLTFNSQVTGRIINRGVDLNMNSIRIDNVSGYQVTSRGTIDHQKIDDTRTIKLPGLVRNLRSFPESKHWNI